MYGQDQMSRLFYPLVGLAVASGLVVALAILSDDFELNKDVFFASEGDKLPIEKLHRITKAFHIVLKDFEIVESAVIASASTKPSATAAQQKIITEVTSDVDFIYADLDTIRGSSAVKVRRKEIAEKLNTLSSRIDALLSLLGQER